MFLSFGPSPIGTQPASSSLVAIAFLFFSLTLFVFVCLSDFLGVLLLGFFWWPGPGVGEYQRRSQRVWRRDFALMRVVFIVGESHRGFISRIRPLLEGNRFNNLSDAANITAR